jgi:hypothetical protein
VGEISTQQLLASISALRNRGEARRRELAALADESQRIDRELQLLLEIARLRGVSEDASEGATSFETTDASPSAGLIEAVTSILRQNGKPMHIQDLFSAVHDRGVVIPGKGEPANLISHIRLAPTIVRPVRGMYGLREWGLTDKPATPKRKRRLRKRRVGRKGIAGRSAMPQSRPKGTD